MQGTGEGSFVFSWKQVELDGLSGCQPGAMHIGATWRWSGQAMRTDDPRDILILRDGENQSKISAKAAANVRRMFGLQVRPNTESDHDRDSNEPNRANTFELTDGLRVFEAVVLHDTPTACPLVMFHNGIPEPDKDYWVLRQDVVTPQELSGEGTICFVPGTQILTQSGLRDVSSLEIGDRLQTRDNGFQPIVWKAERLVSGSRLMAHPKLRPVRIRAEAIDRNCPQPELIVSPDHRLLLQGKGTARLFGTDEVLVRARDFVGQPGVSQDNRLHSVKYIHLMLEGHQILEANGLQCESFHPAAADISKLSTAEQRLLNLANSNVLSDPMAFGDFARRLLTKAEAALLHGSRRLAQ